MCNPISLILTEDKVFLPPENVWNHSHSFIMKNNNIPDRLIGDKYLRLEVTPPEENVFRNKKTNEKLEVDYTWEVVIDELNIPDWYKNDEPNQEDRAREAAKSWLQKFPDSLIDGYKADFGDGTKMIAGKYATLTAGNYSTLVAEDSSVLTAEEHSDLTAGSESKLVAKSFSVLKSRGNSELNAEDYSTLIAECGSTLKAKESSALVSGDHSKLVAGNYSRLIAGVFSVLTAGRSSDLVAENDSKLTAGNNSMLTSYDNSIFCAGKGSKFILHWNDGKRMRTTTAYVGENGIKPNKKYLGIDGKFIEIKTKKKSTTAKKSKKQKERL